MNTEYRDYKSILEDIGSQLFLNPDGSNVDYFIDLIRTSVKSLIDHQGSGPTFPEFSNSEELEMFLSNADIPEIATSKPHEILDNLFFHLQGSPKVSSPFMARNVWATPSFVGLSAYLAASLYMPNGASSEDAGQTIFTEISTAIALAKLAGLDPSIAGGVFTYGGSGTNLYAVKIGLIKALPHHRVEGIREDVKLIGSSAGHYSHFTASDWLGIGEKNYIQVPSYPDQTTNLDCLEEACYDAIKKGSRIACIMAAGGTTSNMGIDNIEKILAFRDTLVQHFNLNYCPHIHVDTVIGWAYLNFLNYDFQENPLSFSREALTQLKYIVNRIETIKYADSFGIDFHKTGFTQYNASMIVVKNRNDLLSLGRNESLMTPLYQYSSSYSPGKFTLETSRSSASMLSAWLNLQAIGRTGFQVLLGHSIEMGINIRILIEKHHNLGFYVANRQPFGCDVLVRCYAQGIDVIQAFENDMNDTKSLKLNDIYVNKFVAWLNRNWTLRNNGISLGKTSAAIYTYTGEPMVAIRIYPLSPFITENSVSIMIERLVMAKKEFDCQKLSEE